MKTMVTLGFLSAFFLSCSGPLAASAQQRSENYNYSYQDIHIHQHIYKHFPDECLLYERQLVDQQPLGQALCQVTQWPELRTELLTFPYLGTRSYEVQDWGPGVVRRSLRYQNTYLTEVTNRCTKEVADSFRSTEVLKDSQDLTFTPDNPNASEFIRSEADMKPVPRAEIQKAFRQFLQQCREE